MTPGPHHTVDTALVALPLAQPIETPHHRIESLACVLVTTRTEDGTEGTGFCYSIDRDHAATLRDRVTALAAGATPTGERDDVLAAAALDVAAWDAHARSAGEPLAALWGRTRTHVDCYASAGFWLTASIGELAAEARRCRSAGIRTVKVRVGHDLETDLARVAAVADALGPGGTVLVDAAQAFGPDDAIRRGHALAELGVTWFEEPVAFDDHAGMAAVRDAVTIDVVAGESEIGARALVDLLDAGAVDIVMPDLQTVGGFTPFRQVAADAEGRSVPVSSHFFTEYTLSLAAATPAVGAIEWIDWFAPLFAETLTFDDGRLVVPERPGHGFTFSTETIGRYGI
ncbi:MAG: mandelate racemase/muconate lactonizing enzyme family protein [Acidimicrobiales bacterium]|nr:mandelate racemase/muconate lactonizing enzyme family protein [Acidimicrobiales bacterium]